MKKQISIESVKHGLNYSVSETCSALSISRRKLLYLRQRGTIKSALRRADGEVRIKGADIIKFYNDLI